MLFSYYHTDTWHFKARKLISSRVSKNLLSREGSREFGLEGTKVSNHILSAASLPLSWYRALSVKPVVTERKDVDS